MSVRDPIALRASRADRELAVGQLSEAFAEGRLDRAEFDRRVEMALTARTHGDLVRLLDDLPHLHRNEPLSEPHRPLARRIWKALGSCQSCHPQPPT